jgi:murein hydrolase activator
VKVKNNVLDVKISSNGTVRSVFDGEVTRVIGIPGYNKAVIIRHGKFLTVYANLDEIRVQSGQVVKQGQPIGTVFSGQGDHSNTLHFEIWNENAKQNPEHWLKM